MDDAIIIVGMPEWNKATPEQKQALAVICFELYIRALMDKQVYEKYNDKL